MQEIPGCRSNFCKLELRFAIQPQFSGEPDSLDSPDFTIPVPETFMILSSHSGESYVEFGGVFGRENSVERAEGLAIVVSRRIPPPPAVAWRGARTACDAAAREPEEPDVRHAGPPPARRDGIGEDPFAGLRDGAAPKSGEGPARAPRARGPGAVLRGRGGVW